MTRAENRDGWIFTLAVKAACWMEEEGEEEEEEEEMMQNGCLHGTSSCHCTNLEIGR